MDLESGPIRAPEYGFFVLARVTAGQRAEPARPPAPDPQWARPLPADLLTQKVSASERTTVASGWRDGHTPSVFAYPSAEPATLLGGAINGQPWTQFDRDKECVNLTGLQGTVRVLVEY